MNKILGSILAVSGVVLLASSPCPARAGVIGPRVVESAGVSETASAGYRVATQGTPPRRAQAEAGTRPVALQSADRSEVPADSAIDADAARPEEGISFPEDSDPPTGSGRIGQEQSRLASCVSVLIRGRPALADVTYRYAYQHTRDTDGDNTPDAGAEWVLTGAEVRPLAISMAVKCQ